MTRDEYAARGNELESKLQKQADNTAKREEEEKMISETCNSMLASARKDNRTPENGNKYANMSAAEIGNAVFAMLEKRGGILLIRVFNSLPDGSVDRSGDVRILMDGIESTVPAGTDVEITRGNSMTIYPGLFHLFTAKPGSGDLIVGEVSSVNDDRTDNYFEEERPRYIPVEEDCRMLFPLCNEYGKLF